MRFRRPSRMRRVAKWNGVSLTTRTRFVHAVVAMLGAVTASLFVIPLMLDTLVGLGWRRPIQEWMIAHGAGGFAGYFGIFYITLPDYTTAFVGGGIIGVVAWKRWWQLSLVYSGTMFAWPYLSMTLGGSISMILNNNDLGVVVVVLFVNSVLIPLALAGSWLTSKGRRLRNVRHELQLCVKCGYNLTGNVSGVCPECGEAV